MTYGRIAALAQRAADFARRVSQPEREQPRTSPDPASTDAERPRIGYEPVPDDRADPGEVVWAWVPFEEDPKQGKDRPVLVIGRDGPSLVALQLTSKDHDRDAEQEAAAGRFWIDIGSGAWDHQRRPSEARVNRLLRLDRESVRRMGAVLDEDIFDRVLAQVRYHPEL